MNTSTTVKLLLALFLGGFLWFVIVSIQAPQQQAVDAERREQLPDEMINRSRDIDIQVGDIRIQADVAEEYRSGEVHYRNFVMTRTTEQRSITIEGVTAKTLTRGSEVEFVEMEGKVRVDTSDGLKLNARTLNYESAQGRIFTDRPVTFSVNELRGKSDQFVYFTESRLLELDGNIRCRMIVDEEEDVEQPVSGRDQRILFYGDHLAYDQVRHTVLLEGNARVARAGSYVLGQRIDARLTDDNRQFTEMRVTQPEVREEPQEGEETASQEVSTADTPEDPVAEAEQPEPPRSRVSDHASGIKDLRARNLNLTFNTGDKNTIQRLVAEGSARLDIAPTSAQKAAGETERKNIRGESISGLMSEEGGLQNMIVDGQKENLAEVRIRPGKKRSDTTDEEGEEEQPRLMKAERFNVTADPVSGEFTFITMTGSTSFERGHTSITSENARYNAEEEKIQVSGSPSLSDENKVVRGDSMVISLDIGDLNATGNVLVVFQPPKTEGGPGIFAIGSELEETTVTAGGLNINYRKNIMYFRKGVTVTQGKTRITGQSIDIHQENFRLFATGGVEANLRMAGDEEPAETEDAAEETVDTAAAVDGNDGGRRRGGRRNTAGEAKADKAFLLLSGERLVVDKTKREISVVGKAQATQDELSINAGEITYRLSEEDKVLDSRIRGDVRIVVRGLTVYGDRASFFVEERLLLVEGRNVRYVDPSNQMDSTHNKLVYDLMTGTMRLDARADQLVRTRLAQ